MTRCLVMDDAALRRFWGKVALPDHPDGCWVWIGSRNPKGYGRFKIDGKPSQAHRAAYATFMGPIPAGLVLDHIACDNPPCVNPRHLSPVTARVNTVRDGSRAPTAVNARKTQCPQGHPLSGDNLAAWEFPRRICLTCYRERRRERYAQKRKVS